MPSPSRFGRYDLLAQLATGGMAEIWLSRVTGEGGFRKLVVIKRLLPQLASDPEYVQMFLDEARINARLSHSNVVQVLELGQVEGRYFMAMEYVAGLSVAAVGKKATQRLGDVPQAVACGVVAQACAGLHYAHEKALPDGTPLGIIHRDVSPQNLVLTFEGLVKVVDFGIAMAEGRLTKTRSGLVKGKFSYMSPEQCLGVELDRRSDIFALGIVLFELCTARRLFKRSSAYQTYEAITNADVPSPRTLNAKVHPAVEKVILRALAKRPDDRFATAEQMQDALEQAMRDAELRGGRTDLERFLESDFGSEVAEHRELLAQAERGELDEADATFVSPAAEVSESGVSLPMDFTPPPDGSPEEERTTVDPLPLLGDESVPVELAGEASAPPVDPAVLARSHAKTQPLLSAIHDRPLSTPPLYYVFAVLGAALLGLLAWLLARGHPF